MTHACFAVGSRHPAALAATVGLHVGLFFLIASGPGPGIREAIEEGGPIEVLLLEPAPEPRRGCARGAGSAQRGICRRGVAHPARPDTRAGRFLLPGRGAPCRRGGPGRCPCHDRRAATGTRWPRNSSCPLCSGSTDRAADALDRQVRRPGGQRAMSGACSSIGQRLRWPLPDSGRA